MSNPNKSAQIHGKRLPSPLDAAEAHERGKDDREIMIIALVDGEPNFALGVGQTSSHQWGEWLATASWQLATIISKAVDAPVADVHGSILQGLAEKLAAGNPGYNMTVLS